MKILLTIFLTLPLFAQHEADPQEGMRLFRSNCVICHGPLGNGVGGGIDLLKGQFKRPSSDADIARYIHNGIDGTAMDKLTLNESQTTDVIAYLRAAAKAGPSTAATGDTARGKSIFEGKGACLTCHTVKGNGSRFGPDLSGIGALRDAAQLERSLLDPDAEILPQNKVVRVVPRTGQPVTGRLLNQDTFTLQLIDSKQQLQSFERSALKEVAFVTKSPMPSSKGKLAPQELADLVTYLSTLKPN